MPQERREQVVRRELVDGGRGRDLRRPIGPTLRPREALDVEPGRSGEDVGIAAPGTLGGRAPEPAEEAELDEAGQPPLGRPGTTRQAPRPLLRASRAWHGRRADRIRARARSAYLARRRRRRPTCTMFRHPARVHAGPRLPGDADRTGEPAGHHGPGHGRRRRGAEARPLTRTTDRSNPRGTSRSPCLLSHPRTRASSLSPRAQSHRAVTSVSYTDAPGRGPDRVGARIRIGGSRLRAYSGGRLSYVEVTRQYGRRRSTAMRVPIVPSTIVPPSRATSIAA
jgi:hypothetical protein